jgi:hypothetical protein
MGLNFQMTEVIALFRLIKNGNMLRAILPLHGAKVCYAFMI